MKCTPTIHAEWLDHFLVTFKDMKIFESIVLACCLLLGTLAAAPSRSAENSVPAHVHPSKRVSSWLEGMNRTYDDWFVHQKSVNVADVYLWVYNTAFARDFRMPDRWLDDSLQGADALAFRVMPSFPVCGWDGQPDSCRPLNYCLVDIYFNNKTHPLPWSDRARWTDLQLNLTSAWLLNSNHPLKRASSVTTGRRAPFSDPKTDKELDWWFSSAGGTPATRGPVWHAYDRSVFDGYSVVVLDIGCPEEELTGLELRLAESSAAQRFHALSFPESWRDRIRPQVQQAARANRSFLLGRANGGDKSRAAR